MCGPFSAQTKNELSESESYALMDAALRSLLDWYAEMGVDVPNVPPARPVRVKRALPKRPAAKTAPAEIAPAAPALPKTDLSKVKTLDALHAALTAFDAGPLSDGARQIVFSRGNPEANLMVIGESPGRDEDIQGKPFVGPSGQLLDRMLGAIALGTEDFYVTNVVNWHLAKNRNPKPAEIELCRPFIEKHIELIQPKYIVLCGAVAAKALLRSSDSLSKLRGTFHDYKVGTGTIATMVTYHPDYLLKTPSQKKAVWLDVLSLKARLDTQD